MSRLRDALGLDDPDLARRAWQAVAGQRYDDERLARLHESLAGAQARIALARQALLSALDAWLADQRFGTRRDFALHARGSTKAVTDAEWAWLAAGIDLEAAGIHRHAMTVELRAPLSLLTPGGVIDLGAAGDFLSVTAATIDSAFALHGEIAEWRVVENRTSFERIARTVGKRDAVVWLPGYPSIDWQRAVSRLLELKPAPASIACDPDPDGIRIALAASEIWEARGCISHTPAMAARILATLPIRRPLTERDRKLVEMLLAAALPPQLHELALWMREHGEKGEQEAYL